MRVDRLLTFFPFVSTSRGASGEWVKGPPDSSGSTESLNWQYTPVAPRAELEISRIEEYCTGGGRVTFDGFSSNGGVVEALSREANTDDAAEETEAEGVDDSRG